jgi:hypothetical protein
VQAQSYKPGQRDSKADAAYYYHPSGMTAARLRVTLRTVIIESHRPAGLCVART